MTFFNGRNEKTGEEERAGRNTYGGDAAGKPAGVCAGGSALALSSAILTVVLVIAANHYRNF